MKLPLDIKLESDSLINVSAKKLHLLLRDKFIHVHDSGETMAPYYVWGASGIGKTQIIQQIIRELINDCRSEGINADVIYINGYGVQSKDYFGLNAITITTIANGQVYNREVGEFIPKKWLPVYNPARARELGKTVEQLDDIANGGDGSGNGGGGIIFIDEFIRISAEARDIFLQIIKNREYEGFKIGSKWMFVAASIRHSDRGVNIAQSTWDSIYPQYFTNINLVPTFEEWIEWAESPIEGTDEPHILPEIVAFLKEHQELWYSWAARNDQVDDDIISTIYPTPRQWHNISNTIRTEYENLNDPMLADLADEFGIPSSPRSELSVQDKAKIIGQYAGEKSAEVYKSWAIGRKGD